MVTVQHFWGHFARWVAVFDTIPIGVSTMGCLWSGLMCFVVEYAGAIGRGNGTYSFTKCRSCSGATGSE